MIIYHYNIKLSFRNSKTMTSSTYWFSSQTKILAKLLQLILRSCFLNITSTYPSVSQLAWHLIASSRGYSKESSNLEWKWDVILLSTLVLSSRTSHLNKVHTATKSKAEWWWCHKQQKSENGSRQTLVKRIISTSTCLVM